MPEDLKSAIWNAPRETEACNTDGGRFYNYSFVLLLTGSLRVVGLAVHNYRREPMQ